MMMHLHFINNVIINHDILSLHCIIRDTIFGKPPACAVAAWATPMSHKHTATEKGGLDKRLI